ncbi:MAG: hypothetical protein ACK5GI_05725 [Ignavibacteria bacterium]
MYRVATYIVYVLLFALAFRGSEFIANNPLQEDGYYSLTVARNIALGKGLTIDGSMQTSGFQPLVTTASSLCFVASGGDRILGLRFYLVLSLIVHAFAAWVFARVVARLVSEDDANTWVPAVHLWYLTSLYMFTMHFNGLETGVLLLGYGLLLLHLLAMPADASRSWSIKLGVLLGLMILTRIDVLVPASALMLWLLAGNQTMRKRDVGLAVVCMGLIILPWFAYVYNTFGTIMPSGGAAQTSMVFTTERIEQAFMNIAETLVPFTFLRFHLFSTFWGEVVRAVAFLVLVPTLWRTLRDLRGAISTNAKAAIRALAIGIAAMCSYYALINFATWHYTRYFAPIAYVVSLLGLVAILRSPLQSRIKHLVVASYAALFLAVVGSMLLGKGAGNEMIVDQLALVQSYVSADYPVASGQTGTLGFMRERVLNIDGKVNHEALRRRESIPEYLAERNVHWFCDEPELIERFLGHDWQQRGWRIIGQKGNFVLLHR